MPLQSFFSKLAFSTGLGDKCRDGLIRDPSFPEDYCITATLHQATRESSLCSFPGCIVTDYAVTQNAGVFHFKSLECRHRIWYDVIKDRRKRDSFGGEGFQENKLENFDDVFSDIINVFLFKGQRRVTIPEPEGSSEDSRGAGRVRSRLQGEPVRVRLPLRRADQAVPERFSLCGGVLCRFQQEKGRHCLRGFHS